MGFLDMKAEIGDLGWEADGASDSTVMILTCPECATSYFVDDSRISSAGRTVKCSNCGARWTAMPGGAEAAPAAPSPAPKPAPIPAPAAPVDELVVEGPLTMAAPITAKAPAAAPRREANGKVAILIGSAVAAALLIAAAIGFRAQVVQLMPASQAAYAGLGLSVSALAIEKVRVDPVFQGGRPVLAVTGQVRNLRDTQALSPALRVSLLNRFGKPVAIKVARPIDAAVPAKAIRHFAISIVDPPASAQNLEVAFDTEGKGGGKGSTAKAAVPPPAAAPAGPQPDEAKPLPPGSPDALAPRP
jgi:predicted Zn finger-like uncharacterized protein